MFAFDVSLCEISTFGANEEMHHSVSFPLPFLSRNDQQVMSQTAVLKKKKATKCWFSSKLTNLSKLGFWYLWMLLLDKNVLPLNLLVLHCFQREEVGGAIIQHLEKHF